MLCHNPNLIADIIHLGLQLCLRLLHLHNWEYRMAIHVTIAALDSDTADTVTQLMNAPGAAIL
jgi:hypothetical protein